MNKYSFFHDSFNQYNVFFFIGISGHGNSQHCIGFYNYWEDELHNHTQQYWVLFTFQQSINNYLLVPSANLININVCLLQLLFLLNCIVTREALGTLYCDTAQLLRLFFFLRFRSLCVGNSHETLFLTVLLRLPGD